MRPNRQESDLEFWNNAIDFWAQRMKEYFLMDNLEGEARAEQRKFQAELCLQEAQGLITVYTGRPNPKWNGVWS